MDIVEAYQETLVSEIEVDFWKETLNTQITLNGDLEKNQFKALDEFNAKITEVYFDDILVST